jgi:Na+/H+ antiporter NhaC
LRTTSPPAEPSGNNTLAFYGGAWVGLVPIGVLVGGISWLSFARQGGTKAFWAFAWLALVAGLLVAKDKGRYCRSAMRGLADEGGIAIIVAWMFASILGALMNAGGLVDGITWLGTLSGVDRSAFTLATYVSAMLFAVGTGTSNGTAIALVPVLYPAGIALGADPTFLALAILSGGVFGDNLAPISDTTIVSAFTQGATIRDVVRSRFPMAMAAATIAGIVLFAFGGSEAEIVAQATEATDGTSALLLLSLVVVIVAALRGRHLIEALTYGIVTAVAIGLAIGHLELSQLVHIPQARGESTGLIQDGISGVSGAIIFVLLLLGITQVVADSGLMERLLVFLQRAVIKTVRQAEMAIIWITILISIPVSANAPAELLVGPTLVRPLGERFKLAPARRANLMDCAVCSVFYMLPWHLAVMVWHHQIELAATQHDLPLPEIGIAFYNPYSWAILAVILFSAYTGWNRRLESEDAA